MSTFEKFKQKKKNYGVVIYPETYKDGTVEWVATFPDVDGLIA